MTPSSHSDPVAYINDARASIADLHAALIAPSPDRLLGCLPALTEAAVRLGIVENRLRADSGDSGEIACAVKALKSDLRGVAKLIEHGAGFYRGWARFLGAAAAGYTPSGEAAPLVARGSVVLEG
jgi:hypothetical protein